MLLNPQHTAKNEEMNISPFITKGTLKHSFLYRGYLHKKIS